MPTDSYRVAPPFTTTDYRIYSGKNAGKINQSLPKERPDSRQYDEHRRIGMPVLNYFNLYTAHLTKLCLFQL